MPATTPTRHQLKNFTALRRHLQALATMPATDHPVLSVFLDLRQPLSRLRSDFAQWAATAKCSLTANQREAFERSVRETEIAFAEDWPANVRSVAVFARSGETPLLQILPFGAHLEVSFHVSSLPVIFPLVQMKDRFHRFVVAICTEEQARILEITLGAVSEQLLANRPELRKRIGREWTREHYHQHKRETHRRFLKDQAAMIANLMAKRGLNHLIIAGSPQAVAALREALPKKLQNRVADSVFGTPNSGNYSQVLEEAVNAFIEVEQQESRSTVELLHEGVRRNGLAVMGTHRCLKAMKLGAASELVISEDLPAEDREELVRLATTLELPIEVCENDELLNAHGGVGCLLRYQPVGL